MLVPTVMERGASRGPRGVSANGYGGAYASESVLTDPRARPQVQGYLDHKKTPTPLGTP